MGILPLSGPPLTANAEDLGQVREGVGMARKAGRENSEQRKLGPC